MFTKRRRRSPRNQEIALIQALEPRMLFSSSGIVGLPTPVTTFGAIQMNTTLHTAPVITTPSTAIFTELVTGTIFTIDATNGGDASPTPNLTFSGVLPKGVKLTNNHDGTAILSGTPAANTAGVYTLTILAKNSHGSASQTLTVDVQGAPKITSASATTFTAGSNNSFKIATAAFPVPTFTITSGALPTGVALMSGANGETLTGNAAVGTGGTYPVTITAANSQGTTSQNFILTVDEAPAFTNPDIATFAIGQSGTFALVTNAFPYPRFTVSSLPQGLSLTDNGNGTATISGTPAVHTDGLHKIIVYVKVGSKVITKETLSIQIDSTPFSVVTIPATADIFGAGTGTLPTPAATFTAATGQVLTFSNITGTVFAPSPQSVTFLTEAGTTVTASLPSTTGIEPGSQLTITGATPSGYNGTYTVTSVNGNTITYTAGVSGLGTTLSITSLTESGTTVTATLPSTTGLTQGSEVYIAGAMPAGYNGTVTINSITPTTFTYTAVAGLAAATGTLTASTETSGQIAVIASSPQSVTFLTEAGTTVTATLPSTTGITTGSTITISGAADGFNGTFTVTGVTPTTFTYIANSGLATPMAVTSLSETGTTATATVASTVGMSIGSTVTISGSAVPEYNGTFAVTGLSGTTFTYTTVSGLATDNSGAIIFTLGSPGTITAIPEVSTGATAAGYTTFNGLPATTDISSLNGISGIVDGNAGLFLVGVFFDGNTPIGPAPAVLDVSNSDKATRISPLLDQTFYIGDGMTTTGTVQKFVVPPNATELYIGFADAIDVADNNLAFHGVPGFFTNNSGSLSATFTIGPAS
jgi:hypothetical protein